MTLLAQGFSIIFSVDILMLIVIGVVSGIILGAIPGVSTTMAVALFLPLTYSLDAIQGICLLIAVYIGGVSGGLLSAILLDIPGTPSSIATCFDGHPMAVRGEASKAITVGVVFSFIGGTFSALVLISMAPLVAKIALQFGPYEYFSIAIFSLTMISGLSDSSMNKGVLAGLLGIAISFVGTAPITPFARYTFGIRSLKAGFAMLPALIGLFAVSQVLETADSDKNAKVREIAECGTGWGVKISEMWGQKWNAFRSALIGTGIGILPGMGANICNIVSYTTAQKSSKYPEKFGTGIIDGIVASETSNNASTGGALIPMLTLGIPGDNTTAILLAGLTLHGVQPGPLLFTNHGDLVGAVFACALLANIVMVAAELGGLKLFVKLLKIPRHILLSVIMIFCVVGAFSANNRVFDIYEMVAFGFLGFLLKKMKFPIAPVILGMILGPLVEMYLRQGLMRSRGSFIPFLTSPISGGFLLVTVVVLFFTVRNELKKAKA
jgi:putative tricarboxylic transport membrane protein